MDIKNLQRRLRDFAAARNWQHSHTPKNLAMALMVETAELLELFQWLTTAESHTLTKADADRERVSDEIADVLVYLLQLADHTGVDVEQAVERKLRKNAEKHPAKHAEAPAPGPKRHLLVDWENVQPRAEELRALAPEGTDVWLFHGPLQKLDASGHRLAYGTDRVTLVPRSGAGKNALDFQLSYYIGYISARQPQARFVVVSNDTGYDPMLAHARELGFDAQRCEFRRPLAPPAAPLPKKLKPSPAKASRQPMPPPAAPVLASSPVEPSAPQIAWRAIEQMRRHPVASTAAQLEVLLESCIHEPVSDKAALVQRAAELIELREKGLFRIPDGEFLMSETPKVPAAPAVPTVVAPTPPDAKEPVVPPKKATPAKPAAKKTSASVKTSSVSKKKVAAPTPTQVAQRVLTSLEKMPDNKPMRREGLLKHIETLTTKAADPKALAQEVCALLEASKNVVFSKDGKRISYPKLSMKNAPSA